MKETLRRSLLLLADIVRDHTGMSRAAVSRAAVNDNTFLTRVERGDNFTIGNHDRVVQWISDNWPDGADWPSGIPRPESSADDALPRPSQPSPKPKPMASATTLARSSGPAWSGAEEQIVPDDRKVERAKEGCR